MTPAPTREHPAFGCPDLLTVVLAQSTAPCLGEELLHGNETTQGTEQFFKNSRACATYIHVLYSKTGGLTRGVLCMDTTYG